MFLKIQNLTSTTNIHIFSDINILEFKHCWNWTIFGINFIRTVELNFRALSLSLSPSLSVKSYSYTQALERF